jgi:hypothetical protein
MQANELEVGQLFRCLSNPESTYRVMRNIGFMVLVEGINRKTQERVVAVNGDCLVELSAGDVCLDRSELHR